MARGYYLLWNGRNNLGRPWPMEIGSRKFNQGLPSHVSLRQPKNHHEDWLTVSTAANCLWLTPRQVTGQPHSANFAILATNYAANLHGTPKRKFLMEMKMPTSLPTASDERSGTACNAKSTRALGMLELVTPGSTFMRLNIFRNFPRAFF